MGKIKIVNNITLDGVMQAPGRMDEDTRGGFDRGGWAHRYQDAVIGKKMGAMMAGAQGALLLGRMTYEKFYFFWPKQKDNPFTDHLNKVKKYVVSATLKELPWENSELISDPKQLKAVRGDLTVLGSGVLIKGLLEQQLIDELVLLIFPLYYLLTSCAPFFQRKFKISYQSEYMPPDTPSRILHLVSLPE